MDREEFDEVIILTDISNPVGAKKTAYNTLESMHLWENFTIYFNGNDMAVIEGKIPAEVALRIDENYDKYRFGILFDKTNIKADINKYIVDDKYFEKLDSFVKKNPLVSNSTLLNKAEHERKQVLKRDSFKYVKNYYIYSKEGLFIFINEIKKYIVRINGGSEKDVEFFDKEIKSYIESSKRKNK